MGGWSQALECLHKGKSYENFDKRLYEFIAKMNVELGNWDSTLMYSEITLKEGIVTESIYNTRGRALSGLGQHEKALEEFSCFSKNKPGILLRILWPRICLFQIKKASGSPRRIFKSNTNS